MEEVAAVKEAVEVEVSEPTLSVPMEVEER